MNKLFGNSSQQKKPKSYPNDSILEALRDLGSGVGQSLQRDVAGQISKDALSSLFGKTPSSGVLSENKPIEFGVPKPKAPEPYRPPQRNVEAEIIRLTQRERLEVSQQLEQVRTELTALAASIKQLNRQIDTTISQAPVDPGIYHVNFFERLKTILRVMRIQIEDSRSWLMLSTGKKKKAGFWGKYKKHGTQFGLSSERTASTQAG